MNKEKRRGVKQESEKVHIQEFLDMIAPSIIKFNTDHFICGNTFRCVWALREYPTSTDEQAILRHLGEKDGITLRIYTRHVTPVEEKKVISNAANKNRMSKSNTNDLQQTVLAESNLQDVATIVAQMHRNREPLLHAAVYIELSAHDMDQLKLLQTEVLTELIRSKLNVDRLMLRQQQGFLCVMPSGWNVFGDQFERVLPASSVANLYPFNYSGKTDQHGFYIGRDKFGSNVLVDFNKRADDKTNANILILGNSGQGKSYLLKLILCNLRESGMNVICLDPEMEYEDLTNNLGGCFIDLMSGEHKSTFMSQLIVEALEQRYKTLAYSGELTDYHFKRWLDLQAAGPEYITTNINQFGEKTYFLTNEVEEQINNWYRGNAYIYDNNSIDDGDEFERLTETIEKAICRYGIRFVCIDNLMTALDVDLKDDMYRAQSKFIKRLKVIAVKYNIVVLIVAHPRKTQSNIENDDVSGSGDITNRVDVVMAYSRTDGEDCDSKLSILKNRLTGKLTSKGEEIKLFYSNSTKRISSLCSNDKSYSWESEQNPIEPGFFALPF